jgi:superfamily II RNA helicase
MVSRGGPVLGGKPRRTWGALAISIALVALALAAAPALATTDRPDYDAQVNPICASANAQSEQVDALFVQTFAQLKHRASKVHGKKRKKILNRLEGLFYDITDQQVAVYNAELGRLKQVSAAPGDEKLVSDWLTARQQVLDLTSQANAIARVSDRLFTRAFEKTRSLRQFIRLQKKVSALDRQVDVLYSQIEPLYRQDIELGAKLGAAYCVSEATGTA